MTVPVEESVRGDILSLSLSSPHFRCHFASLTPTSTLEFCSTNYTMSVFGTTDANVICKDGYRLLAEKRKSYAFYDFKPTFLCAADIVRQVGGGGTSFNFVKTAGGGCSSSSMTEAYRVANNISQSAYLEYMIGQVPTATSKLSSKVDGLKTKFATCQPSGRLASLGFTAVMLLMFSLFWDLYLLLSLTFTSGSVNQAEMKLWWVSGGAFGALLVFVMLLTGTIHLLYSLEYIVMIRFPSTYDQSLFFVDFIDTFIIWGLYVSLVVVVLHYVSVRLRGVWNSKKKKESESDAKNPCVEMKEIHDETSRKLLQKENLDKCTLLLLLKDTLLLNSALKDAGIETSGERFKIIMTLKTIEREIAEAAHLNGADLEFIPAIEGPRFLSGTNMQYSPQPQLVGQQILGFPTPPPRHSGYGSA
eukprot:CAMPEP_0173089690 /NCGR_PEP_ID=MMETSP1102-20130122/26187_1 /TAXON_ID=49646 /ORGANISM="Geminigera sp., Strain Caron Lab Isolate" /LENGTH=416 /DNA_ID=CAMNT_0013973847 /DNA_START=275 /DNA_END=1525 /DNA_ORIENTATION=+